MLVNRLLYPWPQHVVIQNLGLFRRELACSDQEIVINGIVFLLNAIEIGPVLVQCCIVLDFSRLRAVLTTEANVGLDQGGNLRRNANRRR